MTYVYSRQLKRTGRVPRTLELPDSGLTGTFRMTDETTLELTLPGDEKVVLVIKNAQVFAQLQPVTDPLSNMLPAAAAADAPEEPEHEADPADAGNPVLEI